jgi:hypothetical protein
MNTIECTKAIQQAVNKLGSGFMMDGATFARAPEIGLDPGLGFYVLGRFGALGNARPEVVVSAAVFLAPGAAASYWGDAAAKADPLQAAALFYECAANWGRARLAGVAGLERCNELAAKVVDAASPIGAPLVAALRALPRVDDAAGLAVQLGFCMRELRMARHGIAVLADGLSPLEAILSGGGGEGNAQMFGWQPPFADVSDLAGRRAAVEAHTDALHAKDLEVLTDAERDELATGYAAAFAAVS